MFLCLCGPLVLLTFVFFVSFLSSKHIFVFFLLSLSPSWSICFPSLPPHITVHGCPLQEEEVEEFGVSLVTLGPMPPCSHALLPSHL